MISAWALAIFCFCYFVNLVSNHALFSEPDDAARAVMCLIGFILAICEIAGIIK